MSESRYLRKGSKVTICLTPGDYAVTPGMLEYNGQTAVISKVCRKRVKNSARHGDEGTEVNFRVTSKLGETKKRPLPESTVYGYELEDIVSEFGIPYTFTKDMIV